MKHPAVGIDMGTSTTRVVVCDKSSESKFPKVLATASASATGMKHGYVTHIEEAADSIREAVHKAAKSAQTPVKRAYFSVQGQSLGSEIIETSVMVSKGDNEVTTLDLEALFEKAEKTLATHSKNKKILHTVPLRYYLDDEEVLGDPIGLYGSKLKARVLFVTVLTHHFDNMLHTAHEAGIDVIDVVAAPLATSVPALRTQPKQVGVALVTIGSSTTSIALFEEQTIIGIASFPFGADSVTNDIALGLKISLEEAEEIKRDPSSVKNTLKKQVHTIIEARITDIFELIAKYLKKHKREGLLPAGITITGGGSNVIGIEELAKNYFELPAKVIQTKKLPYKPPRELPDNSWITAYSLCLFDNEDEPSIATHSIQRFGRGLGSRLKAFFEHFMP